MRAKPRVHYLVVPVFIMTALVAAPAHAKVGVYALPTHFQFEPNADNPERLKLYGGFAVHDPSVTKSDPEFHELYPTRVGFVYFSCPSGKAAECVDQWRELESVAQGDCPIIGLPFAPVSTVRELCDAEAQPEPYPMSYSTIMDSPFCDGLVEALWQPADPNEACNNGAGGAGGSAGGSAGNAGSAGMAGSAGVEADADDGDVSSTGCSVTGGAPSGPISLASWLLAGLGAAALRRRRRAAVS
jgi:MYXO-CTERM domain-containing protein